MSKQSEPNLPTCNSCAHWGVNFGASQSSSRSGETRSACRNRDGASESRHSCPLYELADNDIYRKRMEIRHDCRRLRWSELTAAQQQAKRFSK